MAHAPEEADEYQHEYQGYYKLIDNQDRAVTAVIKAYRPLIGNAANEGTEETTWT